MGVKTSERRRDARQPAACSVEVLDDRGRLLARGRATNISENGLFLLTGRCPNLPSSGRVMLKITLPAPRQKRSRRGAGRIVVYLGRIVRRQVLGQLSGVGVEFVRKLA